MKKLKNLVFLIITFQLQAQETNKISIKSLDYGVAGIYTNLKNNGVRGICGNIELSTIYKQNIISLDFNVGLGIAKTDNKIYDLQGFMGIDLLYSQEIKLSENFSLEPQSGLGYIIQSNTSDAGDKSAIALPIKLKILFNTSKKFSLGIVPSANINNVNTFYSANFILHFKF